MVFAACLLTYSLTLTGITQSKAAEVFFLFTNVGDWKTLLLSVMSAIPILFSFQQFLSYSPFITSS
jgi:hypothetical protein